MKPQCFGLGDQEAPTSLFSHLVKKNQHYQPFAELHLPEDLAQNYQILLPPPLPPHIP